MGFWPRWFYRVEPWLRQTILLLWQKLKSRSLPLLIPVFPPSSLKKIGKKAAIVLPKTYTSNAYHYQLLESNMPKLLYHYPKNKGIKCIALSFLYNKKTPWELSSECHFNLLSFFFQSYWFDTCEEFLNFSAFQTFKLLRQNFSSYGKILVYHHCKPPF